MGVALICDGCLNRLDPKDAKQVGDLDAVVYCPGCFATWTATEATIAAARVTAVTTFTAARQATLLEARLKLQKLPDDPGGG